MDRRILLLLAALVVLLAVAYLTGIFGGDASTIEAPEFSLRDADLESVVLARDGDTLAIEKQGERWMLTKPVRAEADTSKISALLDDLRGIQSTAVVSTKAERHGRYEVDDGSATLVGLTFDDGVQELYIGKSGPDFQARYIRQGGDERVVEATGVPNIVVTQDNWRDKGLWALPPSSISSLEVQSPDATYGLSRTAGAWMVNTADETLPADSAGVFPLLERVANLNADGFLPDLKADSIRSVADHRLRVTLQDGTTRRLDVLKRDSDLAATMDDESDVYKIYSYRLSQLVPPMSDVIP
jgi:hypothetical protein